MPLAPASAPPGGQSQQPPFGSTSATGATPNRGYEAAGLQKLGVLIKNMEQIIPEVGASSEVGRDILKALNMLVKHVPQGSVTPAAQKNSIEAQQRTLAQNNQQMQALRQRLMQRAGGGGAGAGGPPAGGQPGMAA